MLAKRRVWIGIGICVLALSGALWAAWQSGSGAGGATQVAASGTPAPSAPASGAGATPAPSWQRVWEPGLQYTYALEYGQSLAFGQTDPKAAREEAEFSMKIAGELTRTAVDQFGSDQFYVQYQLRPKRLDLAGADAASRDKLRAAISRPFYVKFDRSGAARSIFLPRGVDPVPQGVLRSLAASLQVVLAPTRSGEWSAEEVDTTGAYQASYRRVGEPHAYEKKRLRYLQVATPEGLRPLSDGTRITPHGQTRVTLDGRLWIEGLRAEESLEIVTGGEALPLLGKLDVDLRRISESQAPELIGSFQADLPKLGESELSVVTFALESREDQLRRIVNGATLASLLTELRGLPADQSTRGPKTAQIMYRLTALFQLEPKRASEIPKLIRREKEQNVYSSLIGSLSAASNPESVRALADVAGDASLDGFVRVDAIAGLGVVETPDANGVQRLKGLARDADEDLRTTATLALGTTSRNLQRNGDPSGLGILDELSAASAASSDARERALQLSALANTASPRALPVIEDALRSQAPEVRGAAVSALRIIPDARADRILASRMLTDPAPAVRSSAIFASGFRPLAPLLPALSQTLQTDSEASVRLEAVRLIGENRNKIPKAAAELLLQASERDASADVRSAATSFLNAMLQPRSAPAPVRR